MTQERSTPKRSLTKKACEAKMSILYICLTRHEIIFNRNDYKDSSYPVDSNTKEIRIARNVSRRQKRYIFLYNLCNSKRRTSIFARGQFKTGSKCVHSSVRMQLKWQTFGSTDDSKSASDLKNGSSYLVYKKSGALDKFSELKPCLIPCTRTISISSPVSGANQDTSER